MHPIATGPGKQCRQEWDWLFGVELHVAKHLRTALFDCFLCDHGCRLIGCFCVLIFLGMDVMWYRCKTPRALHAEERPNTAKSRTLRKSGLGVSESGDRRAGRLPRIITCTAKQILKGTKQKKDGEPKQYRCIMCPVKAMLEQFLTLPEVEAPGPKRAESGRDDR